jgi:hypothetical protein
MALPSSATGKPPRSMFRLLPMNQRLRLRDQLNWACHTACMKEASKGDWVHSFEGALLASRPSLKRSRIFSPLVLREISTLVAQGLSAAEIAEKLGCSIGTLRVKCSHHGISLRRCDGSSTRPGRIPHARIVIQLGRTAAIGLQQRAQTQGTTGPRLAAALIEAIVQDNLYEAVIDRETVVGFEQAIGNLAAASQAAHRNGKKST